uniref:Putative Single-stranded nucleic acid binding R3H protein isoform 2 n=1 Tax=Davidia involucrata TaxID=16924 RepID=A0A5B7C3B1_DAVIN
MSATEFAMVEELAFLIKDNLPCKHLVLSMEEGLVNFLQDDTSSDGVLELEPMNSYNRLLLHRLADIFGFSHQSVGEGDDRHLILERCPETSIPSILVSDLLWQYDEFQSPMSHQLLRRKNASPVLKVETPTFQFSLEEREAAYLAARERIFSMDGGEAKEPIKQKPRNIPVVARRMIAHALGQRINPSSQAVSLKSTKEYGEQNDLMNNTAPIFETYEETNNLSGRKENSCGKPKVSECNSSAALHTERKVSDKPVDKASTRVGIPRTGRNQIGVQKDNLKEEHIGAAKRMFAHALGFHSAKDGILSKCSEMKQTE